MYILRRREWPEYWPTGGVSAKLPPAPAQSTTYRTGMSAAEYWRALCNAEAGDFVYRKVANVDRLYVVRPKGLASDMELTDRYALEDPFTNTDILHTEKPQDYLIQPSLGKYQVLESPHPTVRGRYVRYKRTGGGSKSIPVNKDGRWIRVPYVVESEETTTVSSRYGYTWRGITREHDRELGIAGGELLVVDVLSGEVVGVRRGFALSGRVPNSPTGIWWLSVSRCPNGSTSNQMFIESVLLPSGN